MTRVLHVLDHSLPLHSGYTFRTRAILKAQQADGYEVRAVTGARHAASGPPEETLEGLPFTRTRHVPGGPPLWREWREVAALTRAILALAKTWRPDIIHAHSPALCGLAGLRAARRLGVPMVYEIRAFWEDAAVGNGTGREGSVKYRLTRALEDHVVARADAVVAICEGLRSDLIARGHRAERISLSPNGVDLALFGEPATRDPDLAAATGLGAGPVLGFIGSFYDYEGLSDLIAAMPQLRARHPAAQLLLVGGGPVEQRLRAEAAGLGDAVIFAGRVPHDAVERYYALCDVLVYPRRQSRLTDLVTPLKPLEAMAQRRLVSASDVGGHRDLITHGVTGTLFAPDDPAAMARTLADLLASPHTWQALREEGRRHVECNHDWARNVRAYRAVYQSLIQPAQNKRG